MSSSCGIRYYNTQAGCDIDLLLLFRANIILALFCLHCSVTLQDLTAVWASQKEKKETCEKIVQIKFCEVYAFFISCFVLQVNSLGKFKLRLIYKTVIFYLHVPYLNIIYNLLLKLENKWRNYLENRKDAQKTGNRSLRAFSSLPLSNFMTLRQSLHLQPCFLCSPLFPFSS